MKYTQYFLMTRQRPDRLGILEEWIAQAVLQPDAEVVQKDGRIRRWAKIVALENRYLRVVLLSDGKTVHNAFLDRRFKP